jgi:hypothetical protein
MVLLPEDPSSRVTYPVLEILRRGFRGLGACQAGSHKGAIVGWQVVKSCMPIAIEMGE